MALFEALVGSRINETLDNYARAGQMMTASPLFDTTPPPGTLEYQNDSCFWQALFTDRRPFVNKLFNLRNMIVSEWVPRVPGLAHKPESRQLLQISTEGSQRYCELDGFKVYQPQEKSAHVMSGVGTLRLPPNSDGEWLFSVSSADDTSLGVPVLISADVWDKIQKDNSCEGRVISGTVRWLPMAMEWSNHFRSTGDIPPGYFVIKNPDVITVEDRVDRTWVYPFTIMEYQSNVSELFDYVYCGAHTDGGQFRPGIGAFFETYRNKFGGVHSRFLIAGDLVDGLWPAVFNSPADLLADDGSAHSQLSLLTERVKEHMLGQTVLDELLAKMSVVLSEDDLTRLSSEIGINAATWQKKNTTLAEQSSQLLAAVIAEGKQDALLERLVLQTPQIIR